MKKIMFNDKCGLTKAVLEGRKTMTRRFEKSLEKLPADDSPFTALEICRDYDKIRVRRYFRGSHVETIYISPKYRIGEVVAVAQSYRELEKEIKAEGLPVVLNDEYIKHAGYRNKMFTRSDFMFYQVRITHFRLERLQDIDDGDILREGIYEVPFCEWSWEDNGKNFKTPREAFAALIDKVSGKGTWKNNPWVFVYEFELVK